MPATEYRDVAVIDDEVRLAADRATMAALQTAAAEAGVKLTTVRRRAARRLARRVLALLGTLTIIVTATVAIWGHILGWELIVMRSNSMGDRAPAGALIVAGPGAGDDVEVGDLLVMRHVDRPTVTHEAIEIVADNGVRSAVTKGERNSEVDSDRYPLGDEILTARFIVPVAGRVVAGLRAYWLAVVLSLGAAVVMTTRIPEERVDLPVRPSALRI